ncbi:MAG: Fic family protein [Candidatus Marinimicrobia bacterium]|nr:Fic family protein [Candidatus Neomarinimicrobiota bacterium]
MINEDKIFKVVLSNSAQFKFSRNFDETLLGEKLLRVKALHIGNQLPILPQYADKLEKDIIRKSIHGTAGIEGNPLSEEEVKEVLEIADTDKLLKDTEREISNLQSAYKMFKEVGVNIDNIPLSGNDIKGIHEMITEGLEKMDNKPGQYRSHEVIVGDEAHGGIYKPHKIGKDIEELMSSFIEWINSEEVLSLDPIYRAAITHYHIGKIHPFGDGNGRTARLMEAYVLRAAGYKYAPEMMSNYYYRNIDEYFILFRSTIRDKKQDLTPFIEFILEGMIWSLEQIQKKIATWVRARILKDFFLDIRNEKSITQRQYDLLMAFLSLDVENFTFAAKNLINDAPFAALYRNVHKRAAKRDIDKMMQLGYLIPAEEGLFKLNLKYLD